MSDQEYAKGVKGEIDQRPKRFYKDVAVVEADGGWDVALDGRVVKTPEKVALRLPTQGLADVIADEWRGQGERIDIASMFNTRTANVAVDRTPLSREPMAQEAAKYASTDLVCYLAEGPEALCAAQNKAWSPWRQWVGDALGVWLTPVEGIMAVEQPAESLKAVEDHALALDDFRLTGLSHAIGLCGSAVLGVAVERGVLSAGEAFEASIVDERFQQEKWGLDAEAERVIERRQAEAKALEAWFDAL